jgi:hypothetical protein
MDRPSHGITDSELISDLIKEEDYLIKKYADSVTGAPDKGLRKIFTGNLNECSELQLALLDDLRKKDILKIQAADGQSVRQSKQNIAQLKQEVWS